MRNDLRQNHVVSVNTVLSMVASNDQRNKASAHYLRERETEKAALFLALAPTEKSQFLLWLVFVMLLFEEDRRLSLSLNWS